MERLQNELLIIYWIYRVHKIVLLFNTLKYLKVKQIIYQFAYRVKRVKPLGDYEDLNSRLTIQNLTFSDFLIAFSCTDGGGNFEFLNLKHSFGKSIDWDFNGFGKLWNYNLHYCNFLLQENITVTWRLECLNSLHSKLRIEPIGLEPYPVSLRIINSIRFISRHKVQEVNVLRNIEAEANFLYKRLEFHLMGNHLLENAFSLFMAGVFFNKQKWIDRSNSLLEEQLKEQILKDGGHFELSPMYHQIILYRVLELIDWYAKLEAPDGKKLEFYISIAKRMLCWLKNITFQNGDVPLMNDSANGITYTSNELFDYAAFLNVSFDQNISLSESGYRIFKNTNYECIIDAGKIGADYQPGHGHSDALSFILYAKNIPILVERGVSTYQIGVQRSLERSTIAHNTLVYKGRDQSQVWSGFRVGNRAKVNIIEQTETILEIDHDGYKRNGGIHKRKFVFGPDVLTITDQFLTDLPLNSGDCVIYFHFHPQVSVVVNLDSVLINDKIRMTFTNALDLTTEIYKFASQFNKYEDGILLKVSIQSSLVTNLYFL